MYWRAWCGILGPILFVVVFLIEGATRPGYDAMRTFVSQLSLGDGGSPPGAARPGDRAWSLRSGSA